MTPVYFTSTHRSRESKQLEIDQQEKNRRRREGNNSPGMGDSLSLCLRQNERKIEKECVRVCSSGGSSTVTWPHRLTFLFLLVVHALSAEHINIDMLLICLSVRSHCVCKFLRCVLRVSLVPERKEGREGRKEGSPSGDCRWARSLPPDFSRISLSLSHTHTHTQQPDGGKTHPHKQTDVPAKRIKGKQIYHEEERTDCPVFSSFLFLFSFSREGNAKNVHAGPGYIHPFTHLPIFVPLRSVMSHRFPTFSCRNQSPSFKQLLHAAAQQSHLSFDRMEGRK